MAVYYCDTCGNHVDGDYFPCEDRPTKENGLVCEACLIEIGEEGE